ncbi:alkylation response protein AidB-like acyl-CoA dehydrogenase [Amycolatopsis bartoniae]|uniref:Acyl-CoA dehydrogenase n=1 Tax=Amycolatopsis bartoniae TaxID=941986 RepID=A0A8H9IZI4_9PSEU|nr:acyl-CoA dehydrogenase family protein [Amycolatopsis bartoniae]MBB2937529.1 alkylation response protein AidB-like acyl-CoA dehydrogenase [Amycolatopsis bartoniae]TVT05954.1 acyl-CoA dehydrogenase family protein [Amycolatopsis bartoniae]GHF81970.1 acyl-CoA dehydrogenase [Amycolatopsis bartoniae]
MDFSLSEAQRELAALTRRVLGDRTKPGQHGEGGFDPGLWRELGRVGVVDADFGLLEQCAVLTEIGRAVAPVPYLPSRTTAAAAIFAFGTPEQIERWAMPVVRGERVLAVALPDVGAAPGFSVEDGRISGEQTAVPFGAFADGFVVPTDEGVFLVEHADVQRQSVIDAADAALVRLEGVSGASLAVSAEWLRLRGTVGLCAVQLGVLESALERTARYAREREQFGHPLAGFQAVRQRLADAYIDVEAVRLSLWQAAWRLAEGLPAAEEVATAKYWAAEAGHRVAHTAVHLHGGVGIDVEHPVHRYFAVAKRIEFTLGGATAHLRALGDLLAAEPA